VSVTAVFRRFKRRGGLNEKRGNHHDSVGIVHKGKILVLTDGQQNPTTARPNGYDDFVVVKLNN
jgi:hypothetical protein